MKILAFTMMIFSIVLGILFGYVVGRMMDHSVPLEVELHTTKEKLHKYGIFFLVFGLIDGMLGLIFASYQAP